MRSGGLHEIDLSVHPPPSKSRANDPSRLQNRGGKLLVEQKHERKIMTTLPKVSTDPPSSCV